MPRDHLLRALLPDHDLRVLVVDASAAARHAARVQSCDGPAAQILGQAVVGSLLVAGLGKDEQRVTLQLAGGGPMRGLFAEGTATGKVRAYVQGIFAGLSPDLTTAIGPNGYMAVMRDLPNGEFYRGMAALASPRLDQDLEAYFATSEQVPTALVIDVRNDENGGIARAVGVLVQRLPGGDDEAVEKVRQRIRAGALPTDADGESAGARLALPLVEGLGELEILEDGPVEFQCTCSRERARRGVASAGREEILDMVVRDKGAQLSCEFCKTVYQFDAEELLQILDEMGPGENEPGEGEGNAH